MRGLRQSSRDVRTGVCVQRCLCSALGCNCTRVRCGLSPGNRAFVRLPWFNLLLANVPKLEHTRILIFLFPSNCNPFFRFVFAYSLMLLENVAILIFINRPIRGFELLFTRRRIFRCFSTTCLLQYFAGKASVPMSEAELNYRQIVGDCSANNNKIYTDKLAFTFERVMRMFLF